MGIRRQRLVASAREEGFSLVEVMVAMIVFAIISVAVASMMGSSFRAFSISREKRVADDVVAAKIEEIRQLPYDQIGVVGGNPAGTIVASQLVTANGLTFTMAIGVSFMDDAVPGSFRTYADYRRLTVSVTSSRSSRVLTTVETQIAPPEQPSLTHATVKAIVVDHGKLDAPLAGVTVQLQGGPSAPRNAISAADGTVVFPDLMPNPASGTQAYYDLVVTTAGWTTMAEDKPPAALAHSKLVGGQLFSTSIRVYKPITMNVGLKDALGQPFAPLSSLTVSSTRGSSTFSVTGGSASITQIAGELVVPNVNYTFAVTSTGFTSTPLTLVVIPIGYPLVLTTSSTLTLTALPVSLPIYVRTFAVNVPISGATVKITGGPANVNITGTTAANGFFTTSVAPGAGYTVVVSKTGLKTSTVTTTAPAVGGQLTVLLSP